MLSQDYFLQGNALYFAPKVIGMKLLHNQPKTKKTAIITCVEAYCGIKDRACHGFGGKITERNKIMFGQGGYWYVYLCYGLHWMLNLVVGDKEDPQALLIREVIGINDSQNPLFIKGPGNVTKFLQIDGGLSGKSVNSRLQINLGVNIAKNEIKRAKRIGIDYAGEFKDKLWRFYLSNESLNKIASNVK